MSHEMREAEWRAATGIPIEQCLSVVDALNIQLTFESLPEGMCHSGAFSVDEISLR